MRKKLIALLCVATMVMGMSLTVCAAPSNTSSNSASNASSSSGSSSGSSRSSDSEAAATNVITDAAVTGNITGQKLTLAAVQEFAKTTTIAGGPEGASISAVSETTAKAMITEANRAYGNRTFVASIVDLHGGAGTYTLGCPNVWEGQKVTIVHQKADGSFEYVAPDAVSNNLITFTLTSTSPVAIVIDAAAPKTGDIAVMMAVFALAGIGGAVLFGKKAHS